MIKKKLSHDYIGWLKFCIAFFILFLLYYTLTLQRMLSVIRAAYYSVFITKQLINFDEVESYMYINSPDLDIPDFWLTFDWRSYRSWFELTFPFLYAVSRAGVHTGFRRITLVLYIGYLSNLATWFHCGRWRTIFSLGSKFKVTVAINIIFENRIVSAR